MNRLFLITLFLLLPTLLLAQERPKPQDQQAIPSTNLVLPLKDPKIIIKKSERKLYLYAKKNLLRSYSVGLGFEPKGAKQKEGDGKTPEGNYWIVEKNPNSRFYLSLAINYPNTIDAQQALKKEEITQAQFRQIKKADRKKKVPPWDTSLGGEIFIHGNGSHSDWTNGCIALDNSNMKELYQAVTPGTPVKILP